jgi:two-component system response regulator DctR
VIKVLIVDDEPIVVHVNRFFVDEVEGFKVVGTARNGVEAVEAAERLRPDLILLDVYMPDKDGLTALRELRSHGVPSDVILVSAAADPTTVEEALRAGAHDYVIKPFRPERLRAALESYRGVKRALRRSAPLTQAELDRMRPAPALGEAENRTGINELTLQQIIAQMSAAREPQTATEIGEALGMSRVTARRYLDHLVKVGKVKLEMQYGGVGRPLNRYQLMQP